MSLSREDLRARVLGYKTTGLKREKTDTPWIPECAVTLDEQGNAIDDTRLEVREMTGEESLQFDKEAKVDEKRAIGRMITAKADAAKNSQTTPPNDSTTN
jgi:hypothetical protein